MKTKTADKLFREWIKARDKWCQRCGRNGVLECSHYIKRDISISRFDPDNCVALCSKCHGEFEIDKKGKYRDFMIGRIGLRKVMELDKKIHMKRREAIEEFNNWYKAPTLGREVDNG